MCFTLRTVIILYINRPTKKENIHSELNNTVLCIYYSTTFLFVRHDLTFVSSIRTYAIMSLPKYIKLLGLDLDNFERNANLKHLRQKSTLVILYAFFHTLFFAGWRSRISLVFFSLSLSFSLFSIWRWFLVCKNGNRQLLNDGKKWLTVPKRFASTNQTERKETDG